MKILFISDNFPPEGNAPATRLHEHAIRWVRAGHVVTVITGAPNFPEGKLFPGYRNNWYSVEYIDGVRVVRVKTYITANQGFLRRTLDYISFMISSFFVGLFQPRPDLVVATSPQFFCAIGGWALARVRRLPFVFELRDLWPASIEAVGAIGSSRVLRWLERIELFLYRSADAVVAVTESFKADLVRRGIAPEKIHVVINGVDLDKYEPRSRDWDLEREYNLQDRFVAGYIGTHGLAHALPSVLAAARILRDRDDIVFIFAGSGADRERVEKIVSDEKLTNVRLISRQPKEMMPRLWSVCDLTLVPLKDNPVFSTVIPSKIFESMGMGIPILISIPKGEAVGLVVDSFSGVYIPPENPKLLAAQILKLASDKSQMDFLRTNARDAAFRFSRDALSLKMLDIFCFVISARENNDDYH